jgi:hypothetical protein
LAVVVSQVHTTMGTRGGLPALGEQCVTSTAAFSTAFACRQALMDVSIRKIFREVRPGSVPV